MTNPDSKTPDSSASVKDCPICGEVIKKSARKCIHCGEFIEGHTGWQWSNWLEFKPKTIWDFMGLFIIPLALTVCGLSFGLYQSRHEEYVERETAEFLYHEGQKYIAATDNAVKATNDARATEKAMSTAQFAQTAEALRQEKRIAQSTQTAQAMATVDSANAQATIDAAQGITAKRAARDTATAQAAVAQANAQAAAAQATTDALNAAQTAAAMQAARTAEAINADVVRDAEARVTAEFLSATQVSNIALSENRQDVEAQANIRVTEAESTAQAAMAQATADALQVRKVLIVGDENVRFRIDRTEVTNQQYRQCVQNGPCIEDDIFENNPYYRDQDNFPVVGVSWYQAQAYCTWVGGRLPTIEEWKLAISSEGNQYPWGNDDPAWGDQDSTCPQAILRHCDDDGRSRPFSVGSRPQGASIDGVLDLIGNVWEWTDTPSADAEPRHLTMGGSWSNPAGNPPDESEIPTFTTGEAQNLTRQADNLGFRCVWDDK